MQSKVATTRSTRRKREQATVLQIRSRQRRNPSNSAEQGVKPSLNRWRDAFIARIASLSHVENLFDRLPDIVYSIKDRDGRYISMSAAALARCGLSSKQDAIGKTAFDLFPRPMAERYTRQDERLFRTGKPIIDNLDLTTYCNAKPGWCLSTKEPIFDAQSRIIGLACISKDLVEPSRAGLIDSAFADTVDHMLDHFDQPLRMEDLSRRAGLSPPQFERRMKKIFQLSAGQYLIKARIDHAAHLLVDTALPISEVAQNSGFSDQSALSRQFRQVTGFTPSQYRQMMRPGDPG
jgi:AraC-like DNA-binding protein/PAS domain-containing protein